MLEPLGRSPLPRARGESSNVAQPGLRWIDPRLIDGTDSRHGDDSRFSGIGECLDRCQPPLVTGFEDSVMKPPLIQTPQRPPQPEYHTTGWPSQNSTGFGGAQAGGCSPWTGARRRRRRLGARRRNAKTQCRCGEPARQGDGMQCGLEEGHEHDSSVATDSGYLVDITTLRDGHALGSRLGSYAGAHSSHGMVQSPFCQSCNGFPPVLCTSTTSPGTEKL